MPASFQSPFNLDAIRRFSDPDYQAQLRLQQQQEAQAAKQAAAEKARQEEEARKRRAEALATATPEQYNAILSDPKYADLWKYGGIDRPSDYTAEQLQRVRNPVNPFANLPGGVAPFGLSNDIIQNIQRMSAGANKTPQELQAQYDQMLKDPATASQILYNKYYADPSKVAIKAGTPVAGGTHFGGTYDPGNPFNLESGHTHAAEQKKFASTPGAALLDMGIDPNNPYAEQLLKAQMDKFMKENPDNIITRAMKSQSFGRKDNPSPGFLSLQKQYPDAPYAALVDATIRGVYGQNALPPRSFDVMSIIDPIIEAGLTIASGGNPTLAVMYGAGRGGSEGGLLGAFTGGLQGYGMGSFAGSVQAAGGPAAYLSNMAGKVGNFLSAPGTFLSTTASHIADTPWWQNALNAASSMPSSYWDQFKTEKADGGYIDGNEELAAMLSKEQYQPDGYKEGGEVEYDPERITISDLPDYLQNHPVTRRKEKALMEMLSDYGLADSIGYMANRAPEVSDEERILASGLRAPRMPVGAERLARMATMLGVDVDGVQPYVVVDPVRKMAQQYGVTLNRDTPIGHVSVTKGYQPEDDMDILAAGLAKELGDRARFEARFNRMEGRHGGDIGGMLTYSKEF